MPFQCLYELPLLYLPQTHCSVSATADEIGRVAGELAIPNPLQVPLKHLVAGDLEFRTLHGNLGEADLLVCGASGHVLVVGRELHLECVILVHLKRLDFDEIFTVGMQEALVIHESCDLSAVCGGNGSDWTFVVVKDRDFFLLHLDIPNFKVPSLITAQQFILASIQDGAVDGSILLHRLSSHLLLEIQHLDISVLAGSINQLVLPAKAPNCTNVALELIIERSECFWFVC